MALTFTKTKEGVMGDVRYWLGTITFDDSYPTGGEAITAANFGFGTTIMMLDVGMNGGAVFEWDKTNSKILAFFPTGGATAGTSLTAPTSTLASGSSAINAPGLATTTTLTAGIAKEVGSTANLATVIVQVFAVGQ